MTEAGREKQISLLNESFTESCRHPPTGGGEPLLGLQGLLLQWLTASIDSDLKSVWFEIQAGLVSSLAPINSRYYFFFY